MLEICCLSAHSQRCLFRRWWEHLDSDVTFSAFLDQWGGVQGQTIHHINSQEVHVLHALCCGVVDVEQSERGVSSCSQSPVSWFHSHSGESCCCWSTLWKAPLSLIDFEKCSVNSLFANFYYYCIKHFLMKHFVSIFSLYTVSLVIHKWFIVQKAEHKYDSILNRVVFDVLFTMKVWFLLMSVMPLTQIKSDLETFLIHFNFT